MRSSGSNFIHRLLNWEYWPWYVVYFPVFLYWVWLSVKARSPFFFVAANPMMKNGGFVGTSKSEILSHLPPHLVPRTIVCNVDTPPEKIKYKMLSQDISFPIIAKPDCGERGKGVARLSNHQQLSDYQQSTSAAWLVQEYIDWPVEAGVFYCRRPDDEKGMVTSLVIKEMLHVTGDGFSTLKQLIFANARAKLQWHRLKEEYSAQIDMILPENQKLELVSIGNHCRGTKFINGNHLISPLLTASFDEISQQVDGFYYGRYDVKAKSFDALAKGEVKIMELNGAASEPAHIYHPGFSLREAYKVLFHHWDMLYTIGSTNHSNGFRYPSWRYARQEYIRIKRL